MPHAPPHDAERSRLAALRSYQILDTEPEAALDELAAMAARLCDAPMAAISFVDEGRLWFKARHGLSVDGCPREHALCAHAILEPGALIVPDALKDPRFADKPVCIGDRPVRFYAGVQIVGHEGLPLGTLCVLDPAPRPDGLDEEKRMNLDALARQVTELLELRRTVRSERRLLKESVHRTRNLITVVQAVAMRTLSGAQRLEEAAEALNGRLDAMGSAQGILLAEGAEGAAIQELLTRQLTPFVSINDPRLVIEGPDVTLKTRAAEALGMAIHELATNATKYGALFQEKSRITIVWTRRDDGSIAFEWSEHLDSKRPLAPSTRQGFGSTVLGPLTAERIGGEARLELRPEGACWTASIDGRFVLGS